MQTADTGKDISALFAAEDEMFAAEPFTARVLAPIRRHSLRRRVVLSSASVLASLLAGSQMIGLLRRNANTDNALFSALSGLRDHFDAMQSMSAISLASVLLIVSSAAMVIVLERS